MTYSSDMLNAMRLHDLSVSGNPKVEAVARLLKAAAPIYNDWVEDERNRGIDPIDLLQRRVEGHVAIAHMVIQEMDAESEASLLLNLGKDYQSAFASYVQFFRTYNKVQKKK